MFNNTLQAGAYHPDNNIDPTAIAYDPVRDELFVCDVDEPDLSVVSLSTGSTVGTVHLNGSADALVYDPANGEIYVATYAPNLGLGTGFLEAVSAHNNSVVFRKSLGQTTINALVYDAHVSEVIGVGANSLGQGEILGLSTLNNTTVPFGGVGESLGDVALDPASGQLFVTDRSSEAVYVINVTNGSYVRTIGPKFLPQGIAYDARTSTVVVDGVIRNDEGSGKVVTINASSYAVGSNVSVGGYPEGITVDPTTHDWWVAIGPVIQNTTLVILSDENRSVISELVTPSVVQGMTYDPDSATMFVSEWYGGIVGYNDTSISPTRTIITGATPESATFDSTDGNLYITSDSFPPSPAGLYTISGQSNRIVGSASIPSEGVAAVFDSVKNMFFVAEPHAGEIAVVSAANESLYATIPVGYTPSALAYDPVVGEVFVANTDSNNVSVISDSSDRVVTSVSVGSNPYGLTVDAPDGKVFVPNAQSNNVSVISVSSDRVIGNIRVGQWPDAAAFDSLADQVLIANAGVLGNGSLSIINGTTDRVLRTFTVGYNPDAIAIDNLTGEIFVANGNDNTVAAVSPVPHRVVATVGVGVWPTGIAFDPQTQTLYVVDSAAGSVSILRLGYTLRFSESGLSPGEGWCVAVNGLSQCTYSTNQETNLSSGQFTYAVQPVPHYSVRASLGRTRVALSGTLSMLPGGLSMALRFAYLFGITFNETGLPNGTQWGLTIAGATNSTNGTSIHVVEPNGTYSFRVHSPPGYSVVASGRLRVHGAGVHVVLLFRAKPPSAPLDLGLGAMASEATVLALS